MAQEKSGKKAAQKPAQMGGVVYHHALETGVQGKRDHKNHPLNGDSCRPPLFRKHQIKQPSYQPEHSAARSDGFIKGSGGQLINGGKKITAYA